MAKVSGDFSKGKVSGIILKLGLPMMLAEFVHVLYNIVDRMYIGHIADGGTLALTGLGICFPLITLISAFANLYSTGGATLATIARGAKEAERKNDRESYKESLARGLQAVFIGALLAENKPERVIHLLTEYNGQTGLSLTDESVYQRTGFSEDRDDDRDDRGGAEYRAGPAADLHAEYGD